MNASACEEGGRPKSGLAEKGERDGKKLESEALNKRTRHSTEVLAEKEKRDEKKPESEVLIFSCLSSFSVSLFFWHTPPPLSHCAGDSEGAEKSTHRSTEVLAEKEERDEKSRNQNL